MASVWMQVEVLEVASVRIRCFCREETSGVFGLVGWQVDWCCGKGMLLNDREKGRT